MKFWLNWAENLNITAISIQDVQYHCGDVTHQHSLTQCHVSENKTKTCQNLSFLSPVNHHSDGNWTAQMRIRKLSPEFRMERVAVKFAEGRKWKELPLPVCLSSQISPPSLLKLPSHWMWLHCAVIGITRWKLSLSRTSISEIAFLRFRKDRVLLLDPTEFYCSILSRNIL